MNTDPVSVRSLLFSKIIGKQVLSFDLEGVIEFSNGDISLENVTRVYLEGGIVLYFSGSSRIDDCQVDAFLHGDNSPHPDSISNVDYEYKVIRLDT